jgi:hypothetical protein
MVLEQHIKELAYVIWEEEGHPKGKDKEHYFRAKQILEEPHESSPKELTSSKTYIPQLPQLTPPIVDVPQSQYKYRRRTRR